MFVTTIQPRFSETDAVGHINNTVPPSWLEFGRTELFNLFFTGRNYTEWPLIVKTYTLTFEREMHYGEDVRIECSVSKIGRTSLVLKEQIFQGGELCLDGSVVYVHVGGDRRPAPIPADVIEKLKKHVGEGEQ